MRVLRYYGITKETPGVICAFDGHLEIVIACPVLPAVPLAARP